jgi:hypothetical protein
LPFPAFLGVEAGVPKVFKNRKASRWTCPGVLILLPESGLAGYQAGRASLTSSRINSNCLSWLLESSSRYFGIFDANFVRSRLCLLTGPTLNDAFNDNKLFIGGLYKIEIVFG